MKKVNDLFICILCCVALIAGFTFLRITDDDELDISYHAMNPADKSYFNDELGIIDVPEGKPENGNDVYASVGEYSLQKGKYDLLITYACPEESILQLKSGNESLESFTLPGKQSEILLNFELKRPTDNFLMEFSYSGKKSIQLKNIKIRSHGLFYSDSILSGMAVLLIFIIPVFFYITGKRPKISTVIMCFSIFAASLPLFSGHYVGGFDLSFHLMRLEGIRDGLLDGQFPVVIYPAAKSGHGYIGALYPSLFMYIPAVFRFMHLSEPVSYNLFIILINIFTTWSMFISVKKITGSEKAALSAAVIYCLLPFRIYNIYTGAEVGAILGMSFYPLVIWGIYETAVGDDKKWPVLTIAFSGLIGSHVLSVMFMILFCVVFCLFYYKNFIIEKKRIVSLVKAAVCCFFINLYFLIPFLYYQKGLRYNIILRDKDPYQYMLTPGEIFSIGPRDTLFPTAGIVILVFILFSLIYIIENFKEDFDVKDSFLKFTAFITIIAIMALVLVTPVFPWNALKKLQKIWDLIKIIQLPWRLIGVSGVLLVISFSIVILKSEVIQKYREILLAFIMILCIVSDFSIMETYIGKAIGEDKLWGGWNDDFTVEYTPENYTSDDEMKNDKVPVFSEGLKITDYRKNGTNIYFKYSSEEDSSIRLPLTFYRGYVAKTDKGIKLPVIQSSIGTIEIQLPGDSGSTVYLRHTEPWYLRMAELVSLAAFCIFCFMAKRKFDKGDKNKTGHVL